MAVSRTGEALSGPAGHEANVSATDSKANAGRDGAGAGNGSVVDLEASAALEPPRRSGRGTDS